MQKLSWEPVANVGAVVFGANFRLKTPDGWIVANQPGPSTLTGRCSVEIADQSHSWTPAELAWEKIASVDGKGPATYRARVPGGYLVGSIVGTTNSSRTLSFVADDGTWLADAPPPTPPPPPPPPDPTPVPNAKWIGTNLKEVTDWCGYYPFRNFFRQSRGWQSGSWSSWSGGPALSLDSRGNLLSLQSGQVVRSVLFAGAQLPFDFNLKWAGKGTFTFNGGTTVSKPGSNHWVVRPGTGNVWLEISAVDAADPLRDFELTLVSQAGQTGLFNPDFLADMRKYRSIRFMDWQATNFERTAASLARDFTGLDALPIRVNESIELEVMIELANQTDTDPWFCINVMADQAYIDKFLATIKAKLKPGLKAYVELGNECWNTATGFRTYYNIGEVGAGSEFDRRMRSYAHRSADLAAKTRAVLGGAGISVLGSQSGATYWQESLIQMIQAAGKPLPDELSIAPYFGNGLPDNSSVFDDGRLAAAATRSGENVKATKAMADKYGMKVNCYEGGLHTIPGSTVSADPRIEEVYKNYLAGIKSTMPGQMFSHYAWVSPWDQWGSWGLKPSQYGPETGKSKAIAAMM